MSKPTPLVLWLLAAGVTSASAMSLGPSPDSVSVGRALDLRFPLQGDARETGGSLCLSAEVRYGDDRISDSTAILEGAGDGTRFVRVRTTVPVNEPIVSVRLQAGCDQALTRSYTLLAGAPLQTGPSSGLPILGSASPSAVAPSRAPARALPPDDAGSRAASAPRASRPAAPPRNGAPSPVAASPVRPRATTAAPRAETGTGPRSAQGPVASNAAPARPASQPILQLEDPAYYRQSPEAPADRPAPPADGSRRTSAADANPPGGGSPEGGSAPAPAAGQEDQIALMRAELAAARKEIARLQTAVTARTPSPPDDTDHRPYLIAALGVLLAAAAGAWALRRHRQRKTEAGAWWHGSHSVQAPGPSQASAFAASAAGPTDLGSAAAHDLAYPVSMLPEDLERSSMFPDFLRQDARSTLTPYGESGVTLPGDLPVDPPRPVPAPVSPAVAAPAPAAAAAATAAAARFEPPAPVPSASDPAPVAAFESPADAPAYWKEAPRYRELDLDLDVGAEDATAPAAPTRLDEGNLIDFESSGLGGFVKPSARERQD